MLKRMTEGHTVPGSAPTPQAVEKSDSDDEDDDDEEFMNTYRRQRLEQLKGTAGRPQFGQIREAERAGFVSAVDTEDPRTYVVVHLYEPYIGACRRMNRFLEVRVCVRCRFRSAFYAPRSRAWVHLGTPACMCMSAVGLIGRVRTAVA